MALAGLAENGRVLVAGDDKQLPPVRSIQEQEIDGLQLGASLFDFLKSADVDEFPLEETFRLNSPLTQFPESKFYPGKYRSAADVGDARLTLLDNWAEGFRDWEQIALNPEFPVCIFLHDGPAAGTSNLFEARIVVRLVKRLYAAMVPSENEDDISPNTFWQERLAVISPHRAQNAAIRAALSSSPAGANSVVETVEKIQGKERDAIIASYTVSDQEFALAEADFIFSLERFNVTITRAKTKLILIISRRLLDVIPSDEDTLDAAQILREFVFDSEEIGTCSIADHEGKPVPVNIRVRGFVLGGELPLLSQETEETRYELLPEMTRNLDELLKAIREIAAKSKYGSAAEFDLKKTKNKLYREVPFSEVRDLMRLGHVRLEFKHGEYGQFWVARPLDPPQIPFSADPQTVRERLEETVASARTGRFAPFYYRIQHRFVWVSETGQDILWPTIESMAQEGLVKIGSVNGSATVDWVSATLETEELPEPPVEGLFDQDFQILNRLEELEAKRINFGIFEAWLSVSQIATELERPRGVVTEAMRRLHVNGYILMDDEGRIRSRMAELAREVRYVKQRFAIGDAERRPFLVRSLKVELKSRERPVRDRPLLGVVEEISAQLAGDEVAIAAVQGVADMFRARSRSSNPELAGFQARSFIQILLTWLGRSSDDTFVITADTGSGKTEAACLPLIAGTAYDVLKGHKGTRVVLVYPRVRLASNQAQRFAGYLAALAQIEGMPTLTLGLQNFQVPGNLNHIHEDLEEIWQTVGGSGREFPFFGCPDCDGKLHIHKEQGADGADRVSCPSCRWEYKGWIGSKDGLRRSPPNFFLPVTESLHQWQHNSRYGALFGDLMNFGPPRAVLSDEVHLYTHIHGAQVGYVLRRLLARTAINGMDRQPVIAIGMSATLGDPARVWGELIGRTRVVELKPEASERQLNPRSREYFYFIQPEVESRGKDIAGASTTIQSLMCLTHGMRRRTGKDGGYRSIVFLDSIDKLKRLHGDYQDAEEGKRLASLRTRLFDDDPGANQPRRECCGQPATCDRFRNGECWFFAATDTRQVVAKGRYKPGTALAVTSSPIFSGTPGLVEELIRGSDIVFTTSSLEVGYDDPDIALVYQHYSPNNLASFTQRKGRGGRGVDDRPVTAVTLSPYSPRDSWYFRRPKVMLESSNFEVPLNVRNYFVRRGQMLTLVLDALARHNFLRKESGLIYTQNALTLSDDVIDSATKMIRRVFGDQVYDEMGVADLREFWNKAIESLEGQAYPDAPTEKLRELFRWVPSNLFTRVNLPNLKIRYEKEDGSLGAQTEDVNLSFDSLAPGNMTRRYGFSLVHWIPLKEGRFPWLSEKSYADAIELSIQPFDHAGVEGVLLELPVEARNEIGTEIYPKLCLPQSVSLEKAGKIRGEWNSFWYYEPSTRSVKLIRDVEPDKKLKVHHKSRASLRGFTCVDADEHLARPLPTKGIEKLTRDFDGYYQSSNGEARTGLTVTSLYWGADAELRLEDPKQDDIPFTQIFTHPDSNKTFFHGYKVETEGVRLHLDREHLSAFVQSEIKRLKDSAESRWHKGQMLRYLIGSQARAAGINIYEAGRAAELFFTAAGQAELRAKLNKLIRRWDSIALRSLLQQTYSERLSQHPLLSERRVDRLAKALAQPKFRTLFSGVLETIRDEEAFSNYLRSVLIHSVAVRLKQAFVLYGRGDERQVIVHAKIPLQFGDCASDVITIAENGAHGDGTTRMFIENLDEVLNDWSAGGMVECPNALEDELIGRVYNAPTKHKDWQDFDPRNSDQMRRLADDLGVQPEADGTSMQPVMRILYGIETVGAERVKLFSLHIEILSISDRLRQEMGREPSSWELVSLAVNAATQSDPLVPHLSSLHKAYQGLEDARLEESLSADTRLADQVYKLSARLCVDGCQACLHSGSGLMPDLLTEASVSRLLLGRFWNSL
jgi:hypothetical protein